MMCTCPKCRAEIELDLPEVDEDGTSASCPACHAKFNLHRETFGGRAYRKAGEISCASCGSKLGPQLHCPTCGMPFPSYVVAGGSRRRTTRKAASIQLSWSPLKKAPKRKGSTFDLPTLEAALQQDATPKSKAKAVVRQLSNRVVLAVIAVVIIAVAAAGGVMFMKHRSEESFVRNFALASYGVQVGCDRSRQYCQKMAADWKAKLDAGQPYTPRLSVDDDRDLTSIANKVTSLKGKLVNEPEKFKNSTEKLAVVEAAFNKMRALANSPGNSLPAFVDAVSKADADYKAAASQFRSGIPQEMMDQLHVSARRYRGLRPLVQ